MGRRRKKKRHTHVVQTEEELRKVPHTFVMHRGEVGHSVLHLEMDIRHVMEPFTAVNLKVRKNNVLKDFVHVAGPLGVTHFIMISKTEVGTYMRFMRLPRGPTLTFKIREYSLARDIISFLKRPKTFGSQYKQPPLLILNNFTNETLPMKLMTTMFQNLFPSISVQSVKLADIRRCVLLNYNAETKSIDFRHYNIEAVPLGMSRGVKKLIQTKVPNMAKLCDISEYVLGGGCGYGSESEGEEPDDSKVTLPQNLHGRGNVKSQQSAVRLTELGPRMDIQLIKIEDGLCSGEVLFHEFITKSADEIKALKKKKEEKRRLKEMRKRQQEENVKRKEREKEEHKDLSKKKEQESERRRLRKARSIAGQVKKQKDGVYKDESIECSEDDSVDDVNWYRQEVGAEPDPDLFQTSRPRPVEKLKAKPGSKRRKSKENTKPEGPATKRKKITNNALKVEKKTNNKYKFKFKKVEKLNRKPGRTYHFKGRK